MIFPTPAHALFLLLWGWLCAPHTAGACVLAPDALRAVCARSPTAGRPGRPLAARCGTLVTSKSQTATVIEVVIGRVVGFWTLVFLRAVCIFSRVVWQTAIRFEVRIPCLSLVKALSSTA